MPATTTMPRQVRSISAAARKGAPSCSASPAMARASCWRTSRAVRRSASGDKSFSAMGFRRDLGRRPRMRRGSRRGMERYGTPRVDHSPSVRHLSPHSEPDLVAMAVFTLAPAGFVAMSDVPAIGKVFFYVLLVLSLTFHEYGHAWSAKKLGDDTAERMGRLTLNPIVHLDPIFTVLMPLLMLFGPLQGLPVGILAAKPVPVNPWNLGKPTRDMMITSAAGPAMNVVLAFFFTAAYWFHVEVRGIAPGNLSSRAVMSAIQLNLQLAIFNMLPIPPLDGHRVLGYFLPRNLREAYYRITPGIGLIILLALM